MIMRPATLTISHQNLLKNESDYLEANVVDAQY